MLLCFIYGYIMEKMCMRNVLVLYSVWPVIGKHTYIEWQEVYTQALHIDSLLENKSEELYSMSWDI